ncbi:MAG: CAP domain-containing protein, partial [Actinomycetia bacterium]|nr:CAP domain-containing protein [Actinomycetes bacterium]
MQKIKNPFLFILIILMIILNPLPLLSFSANQINAQNHLNNYRVLTSLPLVLLNENLNQSAEAHSKYLMINFEDQSAFIPDYHHEVKGKPEYFAETPLERILLTGYNAAYASEVLTIFWGLNNFDLLYKEAIDGWVNSVYHRFPVLNPNLTEFGYGEGYVDDKAAITIDYASTYFVNSKQNVIYPVENGINIPTLFSGDEVPEPLPNANYPVGYPVSITFWGSNFTFEEASIKDSFGNSINSYVLAPDYSPYMSNSAVLVP